jgi:hypothetical protein
VTTKSSKRIEGKATTEWVPLNSIHINPLAQRDLNTQRVNQLVANCDLAKLGVLTLSYRDGVYWAVDGQHRVRMLQVLGFTDELIECRVHHGLTSESEAEMFLLLNDVLAVKAFPKFRAAVHAGWPAQTEIDRLVRSLGLKISSDRSTGSIGSVTALEKVYSRSGPEVLTRTLTIIRDAYGDPGMEAAVIDGIAHLCDRYSAAIDDEVAVERLAKVNGGVNGLLNRAEQIKRQTGSRKSLCVAAAAVDAINAGRGGKKLSNWWKSAA